MMLQIESLQDTASEGSEETSGRHVVERSHASEEPRGCMLMTQLEKKYVKFC